MVTYLNTLYLGALRAPSGPMYGGRSKRCLPAVEASIGANEERLFAFSDLFRLCHPVHYVSPLQSTCHYVVNHYVKIWHVCLGGGGCKYAATKLGGWVVTNGKQPKVEKKRNRIPRLSL